MKNLFKSAITRIKKQESIDKRADGIKLVFEQSPELRQITNEQEYSDYINSIYPDSKVKGLVYHQTERNFKKFDINKSRTGGVYFSPFNRPSGKLTNLFFTGKYASYTKIALVNIENPLFLTKQTTRYNITNIRNLHKKYDLTNHDGILGYSNPMYYKGEFDKGYLDTEKDNSNIEILVRDVNDIHILGSEDDIERFKKWKQDKDNQNQNANNLMSLRDPGAEF